VTGNQSGVALDKSPKLPSDDDVKKMLTEGK
jgi:hypothetical protein